MPEVKISTKQRIVYESMKLFSKYGFDAVSIRTIADSVNVGNSALYKHFKSKQEILDYIIEYSKDYFQYTCDSQLCEVSNLDEMKTYCISMFRFQTEDKWMLMFRQLLNIEQFKNQELAKLYQEFFVETPINMQKEILDKLIEKGIMKNQDSYIMAMELYAPFFMYYSLDADKEILFEKLNRHIENFYAANAVDKF